MSSATLATHHHGRQPGDAPSLVLVHGWPDSAAVWDLVVPLLADRFHVVAVDLPGVGHAPPSIGHRRYRLDGAARTGDRRRRALAGHRPRRPPGRSRLGWSARVGARDDTTPRGRHRVVHLAVGPSLDHLGLLAAPSDARRRHRTRRRGPADPLLVHLGAQRPRAANRHLAPGRGPGVPLVAPPHRRDRRVPGRPTGERRRRSGAALPIQHRAPTGRATTTAGHDPGARDHRRAGPLRRASTMRATSRSGSRNCTPRHSTPVTGRPGRSPSRSRRS